MFRTSYIIQHIIFLIHFISFTSNYLATILLQTNLRSSFPLTVSINTVFHRNISRASELAIWFPVHKEILWQHTRKQRPKVDITPTGLLTLGSNT